MGLSRSFSPNQHDYSFRCYGPLGRLMGPRCLRPAQTAPGQTTGTPDPARAVAWTSLEGTLPRSHRLHSCNDSSASAASPAIGDSSRGASGARCRGWVTNHKTAASPAPSMTTIQMVLERFGIAISAIWLQVFSPNSRLERRNCCENGLSQSRLQLIRTGRLWP